MLPAKTCAKLPPPPGPACYIYSWSQHTYISIASTPPTPIHVTDLYINSANVLYHNSDSCIYSTCTACRAHQELAPTCAEAAVTGPRRSRAGNRVGTEHRNST